MLKLRHHNRLAVALTALLVAAGLAAFSLATFADTSTSEGNTAEAGSIDLATTDLAGGADLTPGGEGRRYKVTLTNNGDVPGRLFARLGPIAAGLEPLADKLRVRVVQCTDAGDCTTPVKVFPDGAPVDAPLADLQTARPLAQSEPGEDRVFKVEVTWPLSADEPSLYGASGSLPMRWTLRTPSGASPADSD